MQPTRHTLSENGRTPSAGFLSRHRGAANDLRGPRKQAHPYTRGPTSVAVHTLFAKFAERLSGAAVRIAQRAAALGAVAKGDVQFAAKRSFPVPYPPRVAAYVAPMRNNSADVNARQQASPVVHAVSRASYRRGAVPWREPIRQPPHDAKNAARATAPGIAANLANWVEE